MIFSSQPTQPPFLVDVPKCSDMIFPWKPPFTTDFPRKSGRHPWWHRKAGVPGADAERLREAGVEVRVDRWAPFRVCLGARCGLLLDGRNGFFASMYKVMYVSIYNVRPQLDSVQLVNITPITMVYGIYNYSYWGESKPTYILGASHCIYIYIYMYIMCNYTYYIKLYVYCYIMTWYQTLHTDTYGLWDILQTIFYNYILFDWFM